MEINEIVALNVRLGRQRLNLTQEALASRAGLSVRYIGSIERATVSASVTILGQIAEALEIEPGDMLRQPEMRKR